MRSRRKLEKAKCLSCLPHEEEKSGNKGRILVEEPDRSNLRVSAKTTESEGKGNEISQS